MLAMVIFVMQAAAGPVLPTPPTLRAVPACSGDTDELVVCGRRDSPYRLKPVPERYTEPTIPKAQIGVLGGTLAAEAETVTILNVPSKRAMVRFRLPF